MKLYDTLTRKKEELKPLNGNEIRYYSCGPTVYNYAHVGNYRAYLATDLVKKWLKLQGLKVRHVMNLTDVDDKTIRDSRKAGKSLREFTRFYEKAFFEDLEALGIEKAESYPRATDHIPEMVSLVKKLVSKGKAYKGDDGSFYYSISKFKGYGKLSGLKLESLEEGASGRVKKDEYAKENASDFVLWKAWDKDDGDVFWETELGKGRPGWHLECSAMSRKYLGDSFDLHSGGVDLIFPHHENEIAQSQGIGIKFARHWMHNEHLLVNGQKMSKSLGNFYTLRDVLAKGFSAKAFRYLMLATHYRSQLNFTFEALEAAENTVRKINEFAFRLENVNEQKDDGSASKLLAKTIKSHSDALNDDLDVASALAEFFNFVKETNKAIDEKNLSKKTAQKTLSFLKDFNYLFGVLEEKSKVPKQILALVEEREKARQLKDFKKADELRHEITKLGFQIQDTEKGPVVKKA